MALNLMIKMLLLIESGRELGLRTSSSSGKASVYLRLMRMLSIRRGINTIKIGTQKIVISSRINLIDII